MRLVATLLALIAVVGVFLMPALVAARAEYNH